MKLSFLCAHARVFEHLMRHASFTDEIKIDKRMKTQNHRRRCPTDNYTNLPATKNTQFSLESLQLIFSFSFHGNFNIFSFGGTNVMSTIFSMQKQRNYFAIRRDENRTEAKINWKINLNGWHSVDE